MPLLTEGEVQKDRVVSEREGEGQVRRGRRRTKPTEQNPRGGRVVLTGDLDDLGLLVDGRGGGAEGRVSFDDDAFGLGWETKPKLSQEACWKERREKTAARTVLDDVVLKEVGVKLDLRGGGKGADERKEDTLGTRSRRRTWLT